MDRPMSHLPDRLQCQARLTQPPRQAEFMRMLLRLFAELACRLR